MILLLFSVLLLKGSAAISDVFNPPPITPVPGREMTGMVYSVGLKGVEESFNAYLPVFESFVMAYVIPDYEDTINTSLGKMEIQLTNMMITLFDIGAIDFDSDIPNNSIVGKIEDCSFEMKFNYGYQQLSFPYKSEYGSGTVTTKGMVVDMSVTAKRVPDNGGVDVIINNLTFDIGDLEIDLEGGFIADLVRVLDSLFSDLINEVISDSLAEFMVEIIEPELEILETQSFHSCNKDYTCMDYRMTDDPMAISEGAVGYFNGIFYNGYHQDQFVYPEFTQFEQLIPSRMMQIQIDNAVPQSLINALQLDNFFNLFNPQNIQQETITLSYDTIISYYPQWVDAYPEGTSGQLSITTLEAPSSEIMYNGLRVIINSSVKLIPVGQPDTTLIESPVSITTLGKLWWRNYHDSDEPVVRENNLMSFKLSLASLSIESELVNEEWLQEILENTYLPQVNDTLYQNPVIIYTASGLSYESPSVGYYGQYILVEMDFKVVLG